MWRGAAGRAWGSSVAPSSASSRPRTRPHPSSPQLRGQRGSHRHPSEAGPAPGFPAAGHRLCPTPHPGARTCHPPAAPGHPPTPRSPGPPAGGCRAAAGPRCGTEPAPHVRAGTAASPPKKKTQKPKPFALLCSALPTRTRTHRAGGDERSGGALSTEPPDSGLQGPPPPPPSSARAGLGDSSPVPGAGRPGTPFTAAPCKWPLGSVPAPAATAPPGSCERPGPRGSSRSAAAAAA